METKLPPQESQKGLIALWVRELGFTWLGILLFSIMPAVLFGSAVVSIGVLAAAAVIGIPSALFAATAKTASRNRAFRRLAILLVVPILVLVCVSHLNNQIPLNATPLTWAIETFHHDNGYYPESLDTLTPKYLARLPDVRFSVFEPPITYRFTDGKPYLVIPSAMGDMFAQFEYSFEDKVWRHQH